tara:strand:- start:770 stop:1312 length:543 start_codon:yes stop_codon:yes gene_type:complete
MNEEIFIKDTTETPKKPKRKLTEKQLENLAKGREKMKLKREQAKKNKGVKEVKKIVKSNKESAKTEKEHNKIKRKTIKEKRKTMKQINKEKEEAHLAKLMKKDDTENKVSKYRAECLSKAKDVNEYRQIESVLDGITPDILHNEDKLKEYCKKSMTKFIKKKVVIDERKNLTTIIEEKDI